MDIALRDLDALPPVSDGEHEIIRVTVSDCGDQFALTFACADGKSLRIRLPFQHLQTLADVLYELARERRWAQ
jgi:hypothetical protein